MFLVQISQEMETVGRKVVMLWWCVVEKKFTDLERRLSLKAKLPSFCVCNRDRTSPLDRLKLLVQVTSPRLGRRPLKLLLLVGVQMKAIPCPCKLCWKQYLVLENSGERLPLPCFRHHGICRFHLGNMMIEGGSLLVKNATIKKHWVQEICVSWGFSTFSPFYDLFCICQRHAMRWFCQHSWRFGQNPMGKSPLGWWISYQCKM